MSDWEKQDEDRLTEDEKALCLDALAWFGFPLELDDCDVCENGQVYRGLTEILPRGSVVYQFTD